MLDATWSRCDAGECIRVRGIDARARLAVLPASALIGTSAPAPTAGVSVVDGDDACFVPRFPFVEGTVYAVTIDGEVLAELVRPHRERRAATEVVAIQPAVREVPRNLLRCAVEFSAPMSEGQAASHLRLEDAHGEELTHVLLRGDDELWDRDRRRLTVLLDPARIKRGLVAQRTLGYPLRQGENVRVVVGEGFLDATGTPLRCAASRRYLVGPDERRRVDPASWSVVLPRAGTREPLQASFDRPLDAALLPRCLAVVHEGRLVPGRGQAERGARSWSFAPAHPWHAGDHELTVDVRLEDLAGNSVARVFDRDLSEPDPTDSWVAPWVDRGTVLGKRWSC